MGAQKGGVCFGGEREALIFLIPLSYRAHTWLLCYKSLLTNMREDHK
jgi:hypothetical protein